MRKRAPPEPVEVHFFTDPLCPWSWAMEPIISSLRRAPDVVYHSVMAGWLPALTAKGVEAARNEWADAATKTRARIDSTYWERVSPKTSLPAMAAVKAAGFQGAAKGEDYLVAIRRAAFENDEDVSDVETLVGLAGQTGLNPKIFGDDLGLGRYPEDELVTGSDPGASLPESVWWFGRRKMLRSWQELADDLEEAHRQDLHSPAFRIVRAKEQKILRGFVSPSQVEAAIESVR